MGRSTGRGERARAQTSLSPLSWLGLGALNEVMHACIAKAKGPYRHRFFYVYVVEHGSENRYR